MRSSAADQIAPAPLPPSKPAPPPDSGRATRSHVAIIDRLTARRLLRGTKRVETRFASRRRPPMGCVRVGDTVHFKLSGGVIIGTSRVRRVREFDCLTPSTLRDLRRRYNHVVQAPTRYWHDRRRCPHGLLIWLTPLSPPPPHLHVPRQYGNGWLVLHDGHR